MKETSIVELRYTNKTASWNSEPFDLSAFDEVTIVLVCSSLTGTTPTVDAALQTTPTTADGEPEGTYTDLPTAFYEETTAFTQLTGASRTQRTIKKGFGVWTRLAFTLGGVVTDCDINVYIIGKG